MKPPSRTGTTLSLDIDPGGYKMDKNQELREKETRLWHFLKELDLEGALISKRSNFAWFTGGGDNHMFLASEIGAASLLVTEEGKYLLAHTMDGDRIMTEEIPGQGESSCELIPGSKVGRRPLKS